MNRFTYKGEHSTEYGIRIISKDVFSAPKYDLSFVSVPGRDGDLISSNRRFPNVTVSYACFVPAKSKEELANRLMKIKMWLCSEPDRYHELSDSYDDEFFRKAVFNSKLDISDEMNRIGLFSVNFSCQPYRYFWNGQYEEHIGNGGGALWNQSSFEAKPYIRINGSGRGTLTIQSDEKNASWEFTSLQGYIECDSELMNFYKDSLSKNDVVRGSGFPTLAPGKNAISFDGGITDIVIVPRWRSI